MSQRPAIEAIDLRMQFPQQQGWRSLFKRLPGTVALERVNLTISPGEIFGLLGPNGAGKTTIVKILSTLTIPSGGRAYVSGLDVVRDSLAVRQRLGVVYGDERTFFWRLSALDNLLFYAALYGIRGERARRRALELLDLVGLSSAADTRMHHFSSGMRQRASIARGLLNDPDILIMDEPTRALDPLAASDLRRLIRERVANERRTVLLATNIMAEAEYMCDRIAFISHGRIQRVGEIDGLRRILQAEEAHVLVASQTSQAALEALRVVPGVSSLGVTTLDDGRFQLDLSSHAEFPVVPEIVRAIVEDGGSVWSCTPKKLTLDEMFSIVIEGSRKERELEVVAS